MPTTPNWFERYQAGERHEVWLELRSAGDDVRAPHLVDDARAVCDETARRARHNIEVIVERLAQQGYRFHTNDRARRPVTPHHPPGARVEEVQGWLDERFDAVPMILVSWLRLVGDVWLVGTHPQWPDSSAADPLVIELEGSAHPEHSIVDHFEDELDAYEEWTDGSSGQPFELPVAPDSFHKADVSGGDPYGFVLPDGAADATFVADTTTPFVDYLRTVFAHGGFPLETGDPAGAQIRQTLAEGLLPL